MHPAAFPSLEVCIADKAGVHLAMFKACALYHIQSLTAAHSPNCLPASLAFASLKPLSAGTFGDPGGSAESMGDRDGC